MTTSKRDFCDVVIAVTGLLSLTVIGQEQSARASRLADVRYVDAKGYFRIVPPAGWRVQGYPQDPRGKVAFMGPEANVDLRVLVNAVDFSDIEGLISFCRDTQGKLGIDTHIKKVTLGGQPAVERSFELKGMKFYYLDFLIGKVDHNVAFGAPAAVYDKYRSLAQKSIETYEPIAKGVTDKDIANHAVAKKLRIAQVMIENGNRALALEYIGEGLEIDPGNSALLQLKRQAEGKEDAKSEEKPEAFGILLDKAQKGDPVAQFKVACACENGQGVEKSLEQAAQWYRKAADQGHAQAQHNLAVLYSSGRGVQRNAAEALKWYKKAADQGTAEAQYNVGVAYSSGLGVSVDYQESMKWYLKAAEQGGTKAMYNIAIMYRTGQGVQTDLAKAIEWFRKAAERGNPDAQYNIGAMYANGRGVTRDLVQAYTWLTLAGAKAEGTLRQQVSFALGRLSEKMTETQIAQAKRLADEWKAKGNR